MAKKAIEDLEKIILKFRDERDWRRFHHPKNLSMSIAIEAAELMELFQWKDTLGSIGDREKIEDEFKKYIGKKELLRKIKEELADVLIYSFLLADVLKIDLGEIVKMKIKMNEKKYPAKEAKKKEYNKI